MNIKFIYWTASCIGVFIKAILCLIQNIAVTFLFVPVVALVPWAFFKVFGTAFDSNVLLHWGTSISYIHWMEVCFFVSIIFALFVGEAIMLVCPAAFIRTCEDSVNELLADYVKRHNSGDKNI